MSIAIDPSVSAFLRSPHGLLIDGESGPARSGADMPLYDPATGTCLLNPSDPADQKDSVDPGGRRITTKKKKKKKKKKEK
ncbi:hypothetical protein KZ940_19210, partial [Pseudomonas aeruginosa]|nr:hypothetical protein [Pseudomonas aeruginosa]